MQASEARIETPHSERYLGQLCKHFAHRIPVTLNRDSGRIDFPSGICQLAAEPGVLILRSEAEDFLALRVIEGIVGGHLERFAFREKFAVFWRPEPSQA